MVYLDHLCQIMEVDGEVFGALLVRYHVTVFGMENGEDS